MGFQYDLMAYLLLGHPVWLKFAGNGLHFSVVQIQCPRHDI